MLQDLHVQTLRPVLPEHLAPETTPDLNQDAAERPSAARGLWQALTLKQKLIAGVAVLALAAGGGWAVSGHPGEAWAEAAAEPGSSAVVRPAADPPMPPSAAPLPTPPAVRLVERPQSEVAAVPAQAAEVRVAEVPAMAEPAEAPPPAAPTPAPAPPAEVDPGMAEIKRLASEAAAAPRRVIAPPAPGPDWARLAAMATDLSAITKQVLERQLQSQRAAEVMETGVNRRLADIEQRLTFAEARAAVSSTVAAAAPTLPPVAAPSASAPNRAPLGPRATVAGPHSYQIKAASPGMAVLAVRNPMPNQQAVLEIRVGDDVPGLGKVVRIGQRGTVWEVQTAGGTINQ